MAELIIEKPIILQALHDGTIIGPRGKSAYEVAVESGFVGSVEEWLESLHGVDGQGEIGAPGKSAYELALENGFVGTLEQWLDSLNGKDGQNAVGITYTTYGDLVTMITNSLLTPGKLYRFNFKTTHYLKDVGGNMVMDDGTPVIVSGNEEALIVIAISESNLAKAAWSVSFPHDIIHLDLNPENYLFHKHYSANGAIVPGWKGAITFRHDTYHNNKAPYDFRNVKFPMWDVTPDAWILQEYNFPQLVVHNNYIWGCSETTMTEPSDEATAWVKLFQTQWITDNMYLAFSMYGLYGTTEFYGNIPIVGLNQYSAVLTFGVDCWNNNIESTASMYDGFPHIRMGNYCNFNTIKAGGTAIHLNHSCNRNMFSGYNSYITLPVNSLNNYFFNGINTKNLLTYSQSQTAGLVEHRYCDNAYGLVQSYMMSVDGILTYIIRQGEIGLYCD